MARVFITNDTGLDFTKAERYGELVRLTSGSVDRFHPDRVEEDIRAALTAFGRDDFLLLTGDTLVNFLVALVLCDVTLGDTVRLLLYDPRKRDYFVRTIGM